MKGGAPRWPERLGQMIAVTIALTLGDVMIAVPEVGRSEPSEDAPYEIKMRGEPARYVSLPFKAVQVAGIPVAFVLMMAAVAAGEVEKRRANREAGRPQPRIIWNWKSRIMLGLAIVTAVAMVMMALWG